MLQMPWSLPDGEAQAPFPAFASRTAPPGGGHEGPDDFLTPTLTASSKPEQALIKRPRTAAGHGQPRSR